MRNALRYCASVLALSLVLALAAIIIRSALSPLLKGVPFITFYPAIVLAAYLGRTSAGLLTTALCASAGWLMFFERDKPDVSTTSTVITLFVFVLTASAISILVGRVRRVTAEERALQSALAASEEKFRVLADSSPALIWVTDPEAKVTFANRRYEEIFGGTAEQIEGEGWRSIVHPDDVDTFNAKFLEALTARTRFIGEVRVRDRSGHLLWLHCEGVPRFTDDGEFLGYIGANLDVTDVKTAQEELRILADSLEERVREQTSERNRVWEMSQDLLAVMGFDGYLKAINPAWIRTLGHSEEDLLSRSFRDHVHPDDHAAVLGVLERLKSGESISDFEDRIRHADGSWHWISWNLVPEGDVFYAVGRDVTTAKAAAAELTASQTALRQAQKMEAMGQLTGGVAHDFNNLLTPILGTLDMLQRRNVGSEREQRLIQGATNSAEKAKTLVQRLLAFARRQPLQPSPIDLGELVTSMADLIASTIGPQIKVVVDKDPELPAALADRNQLEMALLNLAVNARDAMPEGGTLRLSVKGSTFKDGERAGIRGGRFVCLSVADTGVGMDEQTLARAVEPFFSTKGVGRGTGLGLSMVHGLASQLGGALTIHSKPGLGTNVEICLPKSEAPAEPRRELEAHKLEQHPRGLALLIDDEEEVRRSTSDMLLELGYEVREADSGEEALRLIDTGLEPAVVITDHLMPGLKGSDVAEAIRSRQPHAKVLIVSGYADLDGIDPRLNRLAKPFRISNLAQSLASLS